MTMAMNRTMKNASYEDYCKRWRADFSQEQWERVRDILESQPACDRIPRLTALRNEWEGTVSQDVSLAIFCAVDLDCLMASFRVWAMEGPLGEDHPQDVSREDILKRIDDLMLEAKRSEAIRATAYRATQSAEQVAPTGSCEPTAFDVAAPDGVAYNEKLLTPSSRPGAGRLRTED